MASGFLLGQQTSIDLREISIVPNIKTCLASREVHTCTWVILALNGLFFTSNKKDRFGLRFHSQLGTIFHRIIYFNFRLACVVMNKWRIVREFPQALQKSHVYSICYFLENLAKILMASEGSVFAFDNAYAVVGCTHSKIYQNRIQNATTAHLWIGILFRPGFGKIQKYICKNEITFWRNCDAYYY